MFYSVELLCRRKNGKFATIWLAATRGTKFIPKHEVAAVNLIKTCEQIREYVMSRSTATSRRLSLYLSAQLMYGIVLVYRAQVMHFQDSVTSFLFIVRRPISIPETAFLFNGEENRELEKPTKKTRRKRVATDAAVQQPAQPAQDIDEAELEKQLREVPFGGVARHDEITLREEVPLLRDDLEPLNDLDTIPATIPASISVQGPGPVLIETDEVVHSRKRQTVGSPKESQRPKRARLQEGEQTGPVEAVVHVVQRGDVSPESPQVRRQVSQRTNIAEVVPVLDAEPVNIGIAVGDIPAPVPAQQPIEQAAAAEVAHAAAAEPTVARRRPPRQPRQPRPPTTEAVNDLVQLPAVRPIRISRPTLMERDLFKLSTVDRTNLESFRINDIEEIVQHILQTRAGRVTAAESLPTENINAGLSASPLPQPSSVVVEQEEHTLMSAQISRIEAQSMPVREQPMLEEIVDIPPIPQHRDTIITDIELRSPRQYTSTPLPFPSETQRQANLITRIRRIYNENENTPVTIDQITFPLNRYKVAVTFYDLLILDKEKYVILKHASPSIELKYIYPGPRIAEIY